MVLRSRWCLLAGISFEKLMRPFEVIQISPDSTPLWLHVDETSDRSLLLSLPFLARATPPSMPMAWLANSREKNFIFVN